MKVLTALYGYDHEPFRAYGTTHETLPLTIALELCIAHGRRSPTLASSPPRSYLRHCDAFVTNFKEAEFIGHQLDPKQILLRSVGRFLCSLLQLQPGPDLPYGFLGFSLGPRGFKAPPEVKSKSKIDDNSKK
ncbi:hypothetical protein EVAR_96499_1 [Eumeta japonica]|uniref:Uncharacterized protein n=1 Tax=Eumeta variegata TaxID=151549 RepID=A0A4C1ZW80_EUMVA|nr:hypothetical protein EVAR_96499_1 [Eumeta japonica]